MQRASNDIYGCLTAPYLEGERGIMNKLDKIALISELLVEVSKSHIMPKEAIDQIRKLDIANLYFDLQNDIELLSLYREHYKATINYDHENIILFDEKIKNKEESKK